MATPSGDLRIRRWAGSAFEDVARFDASSDFWNFAKRLYGAVEIDSLVLKRNGTALGTSSTVDTGTTNGTVPLIGSGDVIAASLLGQMTGATSGANGAAGAVPAPVAGQQAAFLAGAGLYLRPARVVNETWRTSWAGGNEYTWAHGLSITPDGYHLEIENVTAEHGYTAGQRSIIPAYIEASSAQRGAMARVDSTNVVYRIGSSGLAVWNASYGLAALTPANWKIRAVAILYSDVS